jgi:hypothetical protein
MVDNQHFHALIQLLRPTISEIPVANTIRALLDNRCVEAKTSLRQHLEPASRVSISLDCWTSPFNASYIAINAYWINSDWELKEVLLAFSEVTGAHRGKALAEITSDTLEEFGITGKILGVTSDNAFNNDTLRTELEHLLDDKHGVIWNSTVGKVRCMSHVIQLGVKAMLGQLSIEATSTEANERMSDEEMDKLVMESMSPLVGTLTKVCITSTSSKVTPKSNASCPIASFDCQIHQQLSSASTPL